MVMVDLMAARMKAVKTNVDTQVHFISDHEYSICDDADTCDPATDGLIKDIQDQYPDVTFVSTNNPKFLPRGTATNLANTHHRRNRLRESLLRRIAGVRQTSTRREDPPDSSGEQRLARVRGALLVLPPKLQTVVVLRYYSEMSFADIAAVVGCREGAVRTRLSRAIKEIRTRLCSFGSDDT